MVKSLRALFAKAMSLFNMMFFTIKKPAEAGFIMLQCLFSGTYPADWPSPVPQQKAEAQHYHSAPLACPLHLSRHGLSISMELSR